MELVLGVRGADMIDDLVVLGINTRMVSRPRCAVVEFEFGSVHETSIAGLLRVLQGAEGTMTIPASTKTSRFNDKKLPSSPFTSESCGYSKVGKFQ